MDLDRPAAVGHDVLVRKCLERGALGRTGEPIGVDRPGRRPRLLVVRLVPGVRHDRGPLVHICAQTTRVVEVRVCVDQVADRLVGDRLLDLGDDRR